MTFKDFFYKDIQNFCEQYATKDYEVYFETPLYTGSYGGSINNPAFNKIRVDSILENDSFLEKINIEGLELNVYLGEDKKGLKEYSFLDISNTFLTCFAYMKETNDGGLESNSIWNAYETKGLYFNLFFSYFLPKTKYIQSSDNNSKEASSFWIKVVKSGLKKNLRCSIININDNNEYDIKDESYLENNFNEIWGNDLHHLRIRIYNYAK